MDNKISYLVGGKIEKISPLIPYDELVGNFLQDFSDAILKDARSKNFPDAVSVAFFARAGNIKRLKKNFVGSLKRIGRGLAFHITPSNIPVHFAFSFMFGLLAGNANVVRLSSKNFPQIDFLCDVLNKILAQEDYKKIRAMTSIVRYDKDSDWTKIFSAECNVRLIWGGDATIDNVRKISIPPHAVELVFPDRYSLAILNESAVENLNDAELKKLAQNFYSDTYLVDQNACSSPQLILWKSSEKFSGREKFWSAVHKLAQEKYDLPEIKATTKYTDFCRNAIDFSTVGELSQQDNFLYRANVKKIFEGVENLRGKFGLFYELNLNSPEELCAVVNEKIQTLTYFGFSAEELAQVVEENNLLGIDRIVPIGRALDIGVFWDGYDLIGQMSRIIFF